MQVFVNEQDVGSMPTSGATLYDVFEAARVHVNPQDIVTAVEVDGTLHYMGEEERHLRRPADGVGRLVLRTQAPAAFVADKRRGLADAARVIAAKVRRAAVMLREGDARGANSLLAALMEELRLALLLDHQLGTLEGGSRGEAQGAVRAVAGELLQAQERRAWPEVAEILETRLVGVLDGWAVRLDADVPKSAV